MSELYCSLREEMKQRQVKDICLTLYMEMLSHTHTHTQNTKRIPNKIIMSGLLQNTHYAHCLFKQQLIGTNQSDPRGLVRSVVLLYQRVCHTGCSTQRSSISSKVGVVSQRERQTSL